jgi:hypothetical protein
MVVVSHNIKRPSTLFFVRWKTISMGAFLQSAPEMATCCETLHFNLEVH